MKRITWLFNGHMLFAALATHFFISGFSTILEAQEHRGPGYILVAEGRDGPGRDPGEHLEKVPEASYRRNRICDGWMFVGLGALTWFCCAKDLRETKARADHQEALYKWADAKKRAYHTVMFEAADEPSRVNMTRAIESSEEVRDTGREVARTASHLEACRFRDKA